MTLRERIDDFLGQKRLAMVGLSRRPKHFSRMLFRELQRRGYDIVPVNPETVQIEGKNSFARVQDIDPPVQGAFVMTPPQMAECMVQACAEAEISRVWLYGVWGPKHASPAAVSFCEETGISVVAGLCPYLFLPYPGLIHNIHVGALKLLRKYPE